MYPLKHLYLQYTQSTQNKIKRHIYFDFVFLVTNQNSLLTISTK